MTKLVTTDSDGRYKCAKELCDIIAESNCNLAQSPVVGCFSESVYDNTSVTGGKLPVFFKKDSNAAVIKASNLVGITGVSNSNSLTQSQIQTAAQIAVAFNVKVGESFTIIDETGQQHTIHTANRVTHDNTLTGNGTSANPLGVNPNAFVGIAQTTAPTQTQKDAAVKVATFFNFNCTGGTNGKPIFDIIMADGTLCKVDFGKTSINVPPPAPVNCTLASGGASYDFGAACSEASVQVSNTLALVFRVSCASSNGMGIYKINNNVVSSLGSYNTQEISSNQWSASAYLHPNGDVFCVVGTSFTTSAANHGYSIYRVPSGYTTAHFVQFHSTGTSSPKTCGIIADESGNLLISSGNTPARGTDFGLGNPTIITKFNSDGTGAGEQIISIPNNSGVNFNVSSSMVKITPDTYHIAISYYSNTGTATPKMVKVYSFNPTTKALGSLVWETNKSGHGWWTRYVKTTSNKIYLVVANAGKFSTGVDNSFTMLYNGSSYTEVFNANGSATSGGGVVEYNGGICVAFADWSETISSGNKIRAWKIPDGGSVSSPITIGTEASEFADLVYTGTTFAIVSGGGGTGSTKTNARLYNIT